MINSRQKGARGERELAKVLREYGYKNAKRGQQYCGINGDADIVDALDYIHIECKRVQALNLDDAMEQAKRDSTIKQMPAVFHRKNNKKWKVTMELETWIKLYNEYYSSMKIKEEK